MIISLGAMRGYRKLNLTPVITCYRPFILCVSFCVLSLYVLKENIIITVVCLFTNFQHNANSLLLTQWFANWGSRPLREVFPGGSSASLKLHKFLRKF